jgi:hypothetical protein
MSRILDRVSLVSANFGNGPFLGTALSDWVEFLGGKPGEVVIVDGGSDQETVKAYLDLFADGRIDKLHLLQPSHKENNKDRCFIQEYTAAAVTSGEYLLFFKIDTMPFRLGHDNWLDEAAALLDEPGIFAISGALNRHYPWQEDRPGWYATPACTINFSLMKRTSFMSALQELAGQYVDSGFSGEHRLGRFLLESAFGEYQTRHNLRTLCRIEDESWTVFHTNAVGPDLFSVRARFRERQDIRPYMNACLVNDIDRYAYYGMEIERASAYWRLRIALGDSALGVSWRQLKGLLRL